MPENSPNVSSFSYDEIYNHGNHHCTHDNDDQASCPALSGEKLLTSVAAGESFEGLTVLLQVSIAVVDVVILPFIVISTFAIGHLS